jgi:hypothetical protein
MAFPTVISVGTVASGTSSITPGAPAGTQAGDILVMIVETANQNLPTTPPTNWENAPTLPVGFGTAAAIGAVKLHVFWRRLTAAYTAQAIGDSGDHQVARIACIRGCVNVGDPWDTSATSNQTSANTTITWDNITTTVAECLIVGCVGGDRDANSTADVGNPVNANLGDITTRIENWVVAGRGGGVFMFTGTKATAGAIGSTTATITSQVYCKWIGALKPAIAADYSETPTDAVAASDIPSKTPLKNVNEVSIASDSNLKAIGKQTVENLPTTDFLSFFTTPQLQESAGVSDSILFNLVTPSSLTYYSVKDAPLTHEEVDDNLNILNENKIERSVYSLESSSTITVTTSNAQFYINGLSETVLIAAPTGTPFDGQKLLLVITDDGTRRGLTWNSIWRSVGVTLPIETRNVALYVGSIYNAQDSKWDIIAVS